MSLYESIGGAEALEVAVEKFYQKVLADHELAPFFKGTNMRRMRAMQKGFLAMAMGGPVLYSGRDLHTAHSRLLTEGLTEEHVDRVGGLLLETVEELGATEDQLTPIKSMIEAAKTDIFSDPSERDSAHVPVTDESKAVQDICDRAAEELLRRVPGEQALAVFFQGTSPIAMRRMLVEIVAYASEGTTLYDRNDLGVQHQMPVDAGLDARMFDRSMVLITDCLKDAGLSPALVARCGVVGRELRDTVLGTSDQGVHAVTVKDHVIETLSDYLNITNKGSGLVLFRGHADAHSWMLAPTLARCVGPHSKLNLARLGGWAKLEQHILERFRRHAEPHLTNRPDANIDWLVLGQHHGLPTRLLDWSENPLIALYFALSTDIGVEAAVWMMEPRYVFSMDLDLDKLNSIQVYFPKALDQRIVSQKGCFTIQPLPKACDPFTVLNEDQRLMDEGLRSLNRIIVPDDVDLKARLMLEVNKLGVDGSFIYPGLDGLSRQITTDLHGDVMRM
jgi:truncated hemoglobin YjbI